MNNNQPEKMIYIIMFAGAYKQCKTTAQLSGFVYSTFCYSTHVRMAWATPDSSLFW